MANYERGVYEPSDEVRVFDGAEDDEGDEGSRLPLLIVIALIVLAVFGSVVWLAYERGVASGRTEPRLLAAEEGPAKVAPTNPGGADTPYKGLKIYERPAAGDEESDATPAPPPQAAAKVTPTVAAPPPAAKIKPAAKAPPIKIAQAAPHPQSTLQTVPVVAPPAEQAAPSAIVASPTAAPAKTGGYVLQIGAYKSEGEADNSWKSFQTKHAALLSGFSPNVRKVDLADKGTWYRLRVGSFVDKDAATALCERLKADGGNCFLAK